MTITQTVAQRYAEALQAKWNAEGEARQTEYGAQWRYEVTVREGRKFDRIFIRSALVRADEPFVPQSGYIHAFVERETGALAKPAGINKPAMWQGGTALASRWNLDTQFDEVLAIADQFGSYLYQ
jgi:hypothetical protein